MMNLRHNYPSLRIAWPPRGWLLIFSGTNREGGRGRFRKYIYMYKDILSRAIFIVKDRCHEREGQAMYPIVKISRSGHRKIHRLISLLQPYLWYTLPLVYLTFGKRRETDHGFPTMRKIMKQQCSTIIY